MSEKRDRLPQIYFGEAKWIRRQAVTPINFFLPR